MEREEGVDEFLSQYTGFINDRPDLLSLLYDIDMLPEQTMTRVGALRLAGICQVWLDGENGQIPMPASGARGIGK